MALPLNGSTHLIPAYFSFIDPVRMKGWVGLVGWRVADGLPSGHPSAAGRAQDRESSPVRDRRSTTVLRHQLREWINKIWTTGKHVLTLFILHHYTSSILCSFAALYLSFCCLRFCLDWTLTATASTEQRKVFDQFCFSFVFLGLPKIGPNRYT